MFLFSLRGKVGAAFIVILTILLLYNNNKGERHWLSIGYAIFVAIFALSIHVFRTLSYEFYMHIGYLAATLVLLNKNTDKYVLLWRYLREIAVLEAVGIYLQKLFPELYYSIISLLLPDNVIYSIQYRLMEGYFTGFSREVSYTMFFIVIGLGVCIFGDYNNNKSRIKLINIIKAVLLFGALFISGKRATLLFFIITVVIIAFLRNKRRFKSLKYLLGACVVIILLWLTSPFWTQITALNRVVVLIDYIRDGDFVGITNGRIMIYQNALDLWKDNIWLGIGWGNFKYIVSESEWYYGFDVHNCYLQILCETGIIGAIAFYTLTMLSVAKIKFLLNELKDMSGKNQNTTLLIAYIQIFFLLYSITEPILYEYTDYILYFVCINISCIISDSIKSNTLKDI